MGEAYRGLTIRIGGDVTGLNQALRTTRTAINDVQGQLRILEKAMRFDPSDIIATSQKMTLLRDRAELAGKQLAIMREEEEQLTGKGIEREIAKVRDLNEHFSQTRDAYNRINNELATLKNGLAEIAKEQKIAFDKNNVEPSLEAIARVDEGAKALVEQYRALRSQWQEAFDTHELSKQMAAFQELQTRISATRLELKGYSEQFAALKIESAVLSGIEDEFVKLTGKERIAEDAMKDLLNEAKALDAALKFDPLNMELFDKATNNSAEQAAALRHEIDAVESKLRLMNSSGVRVASESMESLAIANREARASYNEVAAALEAANGQLKASAKLYMDARASGKATAEELRTRAAAWIKAKNAADQAHAAERKAFATVSTTEQQMQVRALESTLVGLRTRLAEVEAATTSAANAGKKALTGLTSLGTTLSYTLSPAIQMAGMFFIQWADEVDSAYRDMRKTVDGTEAQFERLKTAAIDYSKTHVTSADTILEIEAMGGQMGIAVDELEKFAQVVSNLDIATDIEAEKAAQDLGQLRNILDDLTVDTFGNFSDALVRLGNNNAAMESSILEVTDRIGSMGSIIGMSTPEILAWSTAVAATGQGAEAAGTAISKTMSSMETAVSKGGEKLNGFAKVSGMTANEFAEAWSTAPSMAMQRFIEGLRKIDQAGGSVDGTLIGLGITSVRQKQALEGLTQETDVLSKALVDAQEAWDGYNREMEGIGDAEWEAQQKAMGFSGALDKLSNTAKAFGAEVGEGMVGPMTALTDMLKAVTDVFHSMPAPVKEFIVVLGGMAVAIGPVLRLFGAIQSTVPKVSRQFMEFRAKLSLVANGHFELAKNANLADMSNEKLAADIAKLNANLTFAQVKSKMLAASMGELSAKEAAATAGAFALNAAMNALNKISLLVGVVSAGAALLSLAGQFVDTTAAENSAVSAHKRLMKEYDSGTSEAESSANKILLLADKYEQLASQESLTEAQQTDLATTTKMLADSSDGLAAVLGNEVSMANMASDAVAALARTEADRIKNQAYSDKYAELIKDEANLTAELAGKYDVLEMEANAALDAADWGGVVNADDSEYSRSIVELNAALTTNRKKQNEIVSVMAKNQERANNLATVYSAYGDNVDGASSALEKLNIGTEEYTEYVRSQTLTAELEHAQAVAEVNEAVSKLYDTYPSLGRALEAAGVSMQQFSTIMNDAGWDVGDLEKNIEGMVESVRNGFSKLEYTQENTLATFNANLHNNVDVQQEYLNNLGELYREGWITLDSAFFKKAMTEGPASWGRMVQDMVDASRAGNSEIIEDTVNTYAEAEDKIAGSAGSAITGAYETAFDEAGNFVAKKVEENTDQAATTAGEEGAKIPEQTAAGIESNADSVESATKAMMDQALDAISDSASQAYSIGQNFTLGLAEGILSEIGTVIANASTVSQAGADASSKTLGVHSPSRVTMEIGKYFSQGFGIGIMSQSSYVKAMAENMANASLNGLTTLSRSSIADRASDLAGSLSDAFASVSQRAINVNVNSADQKPSGNTYIIQNLDFSGDQDIEAAMLTIFNRMQRLGAM